MKVMYVDKKFTAPTLAMIEQANDIIAEYTAQGYSLTLRQLYYQFVARDLLPNTNRSYARLGSIINKARLAGLVDWSALEDRTRYVRSLSHWNSPAEIVDACASQYRVDKWYKQAVRPQVWIEKDALIGVVERVCNELDISYFACRGYVSQSQMWRSAQHMLNLAEGQGQKPIVLHFGDHDPSGVDMTRDITDRFDVFRAYDVEVRRLALNLDQIEQFNPPPNPAKLTDSRCEEYIAQYGESSWELDALEPKLLSDLIRREVLAMRDDDLYREQLQLEREGRDKLQAAADAIREEKHTHTHTHTRRIECTRQHRRSCGSRRDREVVTHDVLGGAYRAPHSASNERRTRKENRMTKRQRHKQRDLRERAFRLFSVWGSHELVAHELDVPKSAVRKWCARVRQERRLPCQA